MEKRDVMDIPVSSNHSGHEKALNYRGISKKRHEDGWLLVVLSDGE